MLKHLKEEGNDPKVAFSPEGIERMNKNIVHLNNGHQHQPIYKVRKYEKVTSLQWVQEATNPQSL